MLGDIRKGTMISRITLKFSLKKEFRRFRLMPASHVRIATALKGWGGVLFAITKHLILPIANSRRVLVPSLERESLFFGENTIQ